jgi:hypothetical protein
MESEDNNNTQHTQPAEFEIPERKIQALNTSFSVFSHQVTMRDARQIYGELRKCRLEARVGLNLERLGRLDSTRSLRSRSSMETAAADLSLTPFFHVVQVQSGAFPAFPNVCSHSLKMKSATAIHISII